MIPTYIWSLVFIYFLVHSYAGRENLDELFMEPLKPFWYPGQPFLACDAIIRKFYSTDPRRLEIVSTYKLINLFTHK